MADIWPGALSWFDRTCKANCIRRGLQTGGLLSDVFLHLVPHSFMGEHQDGGVHFVMVEEKRNILIGCVRCFLFSLRLSDSSFAC